jgi:hypothetical protein
MTREENFTQGRLEALCETPTAVCQTRASCELSEERFVTGAFPGGQRAVVYAPHPRTTLTVRILLDDQRYPGTELFVRAHQLGCVDSLEERLVDIDLFQRAGEDRTLDFTFELRGQGDHLIEWFSDASATYTLVVDVTFNPSEG